MTTHPLPHVTVTLQGPDDGGDFGPNTPSTKTSGIQEALDYAHENCRDVTIRGGRGGTHRGEGVPGNIYRLQETLRVPWSQDFLVDGGNYLLIYEGTEGHALEIDSQMNCRYKFGMVFSAAKEAVVSIRPHSPGPDDVIDITASVFDFSAIVTQHPEAAAIELDSTHGMIVNSKFFSEETNTMGCGVRVTDNAGNGHWISNNQVEVPFGNQMHSRGECVGLQLGEPGSTKIAHNRFDMTFHAPRGSHFDPDKADRPSTLDRLSTIDDFLPENAIGADVHAQRNVLTLAFYGRRQPGHDLVFHEGARDNTVYALNLPNGVTNGAASPTNRIVPNWPVGFDLPTPEFPMPGEVLVNRTCFAVQALILTPGNVSGWTLSDGGSTAQTNPFNLSLVDNAKVPARPLDPPRPAISQAVDGPLHAGQSLILQPGDAVRFKYASAPTWRWKAL